MGVYLYKSKPSHVAKALVQVADGETAECEIALYQYAYKPWNWDDAANKRMDFRSGVTACVGAWNRAYNATGRELPKYGLNIGDHGEVSATPVQPFLTQGSATSHDDWAKHDGARIVQWLQLPKGMKEVAA